MNAKDKSKELIYKFSCKVAGHSAVKQCAKIAVEEIIEVITYPTNKKYWDEVLKEIDIL